jgi:hypothetical protein
MPALDRLDRLAEELAARGDDRQRLDVVQRARRFKRSWVDMAEALVAVRRSEVWQKWGYADFYEYCTDELQIRKATADKLTGSYFALREHAPAVLDRDGVEGTIPSIDAVDFFARALERGRDRDGAGTEAPAEVIGQLRRAVFDDATPVAVLRREFNPILHPRAEGEAELDAMLKTRNAARRIQNVLPSIEGLSKRRVSEVDAVLDGLGEDLERLIDRARARRTEKAS